MDTRLSAEPLMEASQGGLCCSFLLGPHESFSHGFYLTHTLTMVKSQVAAKA